MKAAAKTLNVPVGDGARMCIVNPLADPHIEWLLRYSNNLNAPEAGRFSAAELVNNYDYLLSDHINMTEATRRLRLLRAARRAALHLTELKGEQATTEALRLQAITQATHDAHSAAHRFIKDHP